MLSAPILFRPESIHQQLDQRFYRPVEAAQFPQHQLRYRNHAAAKSVGLDGLDDASWVQHFGHFQPLDGSFLAPLALCYHGHQFGHYNPDLGDGRGFLFAQIRDQQDRLMDLGTKGSGTTPFSRSADGRLTLKGAVREILATEMLTALDVTTSQSFSVIETGEQLERNDEPSPTRSAVLVRLSHSHIRIGSFQRLAYMDDMDGIEMLARHVARHYFGGTVKTELAQTELVQTELAQTKLAKDNDRLDADAPLTELLPALLSHVAAAIADTAGRWLAAGFVHGVLNTDNMNITGESFDYGPYRMLEHYDTEKIAAYFDHSGLYKFGNQVNAIFWNIQQLASIMTIFISKEKLIDVLKQYADLYNQYLQKLTFQRLNIIMKSNSQNQELLSSFYELQATKKFFYEEIFYDFQNFTSRQDLISKKYSPYSFLNAFKKFEIIIKSNSTNKKFTSLFYDDIEKIWQSINDKDDWSLFDKKLKSINNIL